MENKIICGIYKITSPSGRVYIGESDNIDRRWKEYKNLNKSKSQRKLYSSFKYYGIEGHTFETIEECLFENLKCRERYYQDFYDVINIGLNCILTECGEKKRIFSEETLKEISIKAKERVGELNPFYGKSHSEETKLKNKVAQLDKKVSKETKQKMSESRKGNNNAPSHKVIDTVTLKIFNSIREAADYIDINYHTLRAQLRGENKNKTNLLFIEDYNKIKNE
jgi:group I intron endonuclease